LLAWIGTRCAASHPNENEKYAFEKKGGRTSAVRFLCLPCSPNRMFASGEKTIGRPICCDVTSNYFIPYVHMSKPRLEKRRKMETHGFELPAPPLQRVHPPLGLARRMRELVPRPPLEGLQTSIIN
jgi:hypothetical protein